MKNLSNHFLHFEFQPYLYLQMRNQDQKLQIYYYQLVYMQSLFLVLKNKLIYNINYLQ